MKQERIDKAEEEARRFLVAAAELRARAKYESPEMLLLGCKESAAVRRASMDLTRALTEMRRP